MKRTRARLEVIRHDINEAPRRYTDYTAQAAVALIAAVDAVLALADAIDHPNHYQNAEHSNICSDCWGSKYWPCKNRDHAEQIRAAVTEHTRNLP